SSSLVRDTSASVRRAPSRSTRSAAGLALHDSSYDLNFPTAACRRDPAAAETAPPQEQDGARGRINKESIEKAVHLGGGIDGRKERCRALEEQSPPAAAALLTQCHRYPTSSRSGWTWSGESKIF
ncbi:MAG: hypothetical protein SGPRY_013618, partial [Prymnesium sp.]